MNEINQEQNDLFEILGENLPASDLPKNSQDYENFSYSEDSQKLEFLIQDMFLMHFFP